MASTEFQALQGRVQGLMVQFLPPLSSTASYTAQEEDGMRALRLLVHAEVEVYLEVMCLLLVGDLDREITAARTVRPAVGAWAKAAINECRQAVSENHGIKAENIRKMFGPLGLIESDFSAVSNLFLDRMSHFGKRRGDVAHQSALRASFSLVRQGEEPLFNEILGYLEVFDRHLIQRRLQRFT